MWPRQALRVEVVGVALLPEDRAPQGKRALQVGSVRTGSCPNPSASCRACSEGRCEVVPGACTPSPSQHRTVSRLGQRGASGTRPP